MKYYDLNGEVAEYNFKEEEDYFKALEELISEQAKQLIPQVKILQLEGRVEGAIDRLLEEIASYEMATEDLNTIIAKVREQYPEVPAFVLFRLNKRYLRPKEALQNEEL